jgi:hypothetical protein
MRPIMTSASDEYDDWFFKNRPDKLKLPQNSMPATAQVLSTVRSEELARGVFEHPNRPTSDWEMVFAALRWEHEIVSLFRVNGYLTTCSEDLWDRVVKMAERRWLEFKGGPLLPWLQKLARQLARQYPRDWARRKKHERIWAMRQLALRRLELRAIHETIREMRKEKQIVCQVLLTECSLEEAAQKLAISKREVRQLFAEVLAELKRALL